MTSANIPQRLFIPQPFASGTGAALATIGATSSANINFVDGFPSAYQASGNNQGKFVLRSEVNAIGNLASANEFARACGGVITFDPRLSAKIGGYPRGAVLEYLKDLNYNRVISLVENNNYDFATNYQAYKTGTAYVAGSYMTNTVNNIDKCFLVTSNITAAENTNWSSIQNKVSELSDILLGEIDDEHWAYLGNGAIAYMETLCKIGNLPVPAAISAIPKQASYPVGGFKAPRNGIPYFSGDVTIQLPEAEEYSSWDGHMKVYLLEGTTDPSSLDGKSPSSTGSGFSSTLIWTNMSTTTDQPSLKNITAGKYYSVWVDLKNCGISDSTMELKLS